MQFVYECRRDQSRYESCDEQYLIGDAGYYVDIGLEYMDENDGANSKLIEAEERCEGENHDQLLIVDIQKKWAEVCEEHASTANEQSRLLSKVLWEYWVRETGGHVDKVHDLHTVHWFDRKLSFWLQLQEYLGLEHLDARYTGQLLSYCANYSYPGCTSILFAS